MATSLQENVLGTDAGRSSINENHAPAKGNVENPSNHQKEVFL
jgi:hypothetical protein